MTGRVTLKQALREYPSDVRGAAARVRDEWRKLTAPKYPRLRLPDKLTEKDLASRSPEERRARERAETFYSISGILCGAWIILTVIVLGVIVTTPPRTYPIRALAGFCLISVLLVFETTYLGMSAYFSSRYGEWVTTAPRRES